MIQGPEVGGQPQLQFTLDPPRMALHRSEEFSDVLVLKVLLVASASSSPSCLNRLLHNGVVLHVVVEHLDGVPVDQALQDVLLKVLFVSCGGRSGGIGDRTPFEASEKDMVDVKRMDVVSDLLIYG